MQIHKKVNFNLSRPIFIINIVIVRTLLSSVGLLCCILYFDPRRIDLLWNRPENLKFGVEMLAVVVVVVVAVVVKAENKKVVVVRIL